MPDFRTVARFGGEAATENGLEHIHALKTGPRQHERCLQREAHPIIGWPLKPLTLLDRQGARGSLADLATAGLLSRQAAFVVLACVDLGDPRRFLAALNIITTGAAGVGEALRTRSARDLIGATFAVSGGAVPAGYLRALLRISEGREAELGRHAFAEPEAYRRLWQIFTTEPHGPKAVALRYCGRIGAGTLVAVDTLDPVLLHPEILRHIDTTERTAKANALLRLMRTAVSGATDQTLTQALQASLAKGSMLESFARRVIEQADVFPPPPLPPSADITPLTSASALISFGKEMGNCAGTKIGEVLLGLSYLYRAEHRAQDGTWTPLAIELAPLSSGQWMVREIKGVKNRSPTKQALRAILGQLHALGAVSLGSAVSEPTRSLSSLLGVYRWDALELALMETDEPSPADDPSETRVAA